MINFAIRVGLVILLQMALRTKCIVQEQMICVNKVSLTRIKGGDSLERRDTSWGNYLVLVAERNPRLSPFNSKGVPRISRSMLVLGNEENQ